MRALGNAIDSTLAIVADNLTRLGGRVTETEKKVGLVSGTPASFSDTNHSHSNYAATSHSHAYLPTSGGTTSGVIQYSPGVSGDPNNPAHASILATVGQAMFLHNLSWPTYKNVVVRRSIDGVQTGMQGEAGLNHSIDYRYLIYNYNSGEVSYSVRNTYPRTRSADISDPVFVPNAKSINSIPPVRIITDDDGGTSYGFAPQDVPPMAKTSIEQSDPGVPNRDGVDIIQMAMLGFAELRDLRERVAVLEAKK